MIFDWDNKDTSFEQNMSSKTIKWGTCPTSSWNVSDSSNIFYQGDNLDALKDMQDQYVNRIKMIYIDPPYNTGVNRLYKDKYLESDWLNMMRIRLFLGRQLLTKDGAIFISIDNSSLKNLLIVGDDVFGRQNRLPIFVWVKNWAGQATAKHINNTHEYIVVYAKHKPSLSFNRLSCEVPSASRKYKDEQGTYSIDGLVGSRGRGAKEPIEFKGQVYLPPKGRTWSITRPSIEEAIEKGCVFAKNGKLYRKRYKNEKQGTVAIKSILQGIPRGGSHAAAREIQRIFGDALVFPHTKSTHLLRALIRQITKLDDIVLDFFGGSGSTAHAVLAQNVADGIVRKFILVQRHESTKKDSVARAHGFNTIADIAYHRVKHVSLDLFGGLLQADDPGLRVLQPIDNCLKNT